MISIIKLMRNGSLETLNLNVPINLELLATFINNGQTCINELDIIYTHEYRLKIYGSNNKHLLMENKHEIPINYNKIFFGDLLIIKYNIDDQIDSFELKEYLNLLNY